MTVDDLTRRLLPRRLKDRLTAGRLGEPWQTAFAGSLLTPLNLFFLFELVERVGRLGVPGDIVECGVYRGGSAAVLGSKMIELPGAQRKLWLFDSFAGMPPASEHDGEFSHTLEGEMVGDERAVREGLTRVGVPSGRYEIVRGLYESTFPRVEAPPTALLHVDCDFYEPVKRTLEKFGPALSPGAFVVMNDYGIYRGAKAAADEFLAARLPGVEPVAIDPTAAFFQMPGNGCSGNPVAGHYPDWPGAVA